MLVDWKLQAACVGEVEDSQCEELIVRTSKAKLRHRQCCCSNIDCCRAEGKELPGACGDYGCHE